MFQVLNVEIYSIVTFFFLPVTQTVTNFDPKYPTGEKRHGLGC